MNRIPHALLVASLALTACEKKPKPTVEPDDVTTTPDVVKPVELDQSVPQEPDPPELAVAKQQYLMGEYEELVTQLQPIYADLKTREQYRASALAGAWLALAHAKGVFESGKEPAEWAASMAASTEDSDVDAAAGLAMGAYQIGSEDYELALTSLGAATAATDGSAATLAHLLRAEALIGAAFGSGDSETVQHPEKFDEAKIAYDAAAGPAKGQPSEDLLMGRVEEGLAAISDYRKDKAGACPHVTAALGAFVRAGARRLLEGPAELARRNKCTLPPELTQAEEP